MGHLGKETKVRKGKNLGGFERKKFGETEREEDNKMILFCVNSLLNSVFA